MVSNRLGIIGRKSIEYSRIICGKIKQVYHNIIEYVVADHNKSFAYNKVIWVGKYGEFPEEFQDNRKIGND